jgi:hypothetical protein
MAMKLSDLGAGRVEDITNRRLPHEGAGDVG